MKSPLINNIGSNTNTSNTSNTSNTTNTSNTSRIHEAHDDNENVDITYIMNDLKSYYTQTFTQSSETSMGGLEYIGIRHKLLILAERENNNGIINESTIQADNLIPSQLELIQTLLVVGTLIFSVILTLATANPYVSESNLNFFGDTGVYIIKIIYRILVTAIIMGTIYLIAALLFSYIALAIWLQNSISRIKFLKQFPPIKIIGLAAVLLVSIIFMIPVSLALTSDPIDAFISILFIGIIIPVTYYFIPINNDLCREWQKDDIMSLIKKLEQSIRKP